MALEFVDLFFLINHFKRKELFCWGSARFLTERKLSRVSTPLISGRWQDKRVETLGAYCVQLD